MRGKGFVLLNNPEMIKRMYRGRETFRRNSSLKIFSFLYMDSWYSAGAYTGGPVILLPLPPEIYGQRLESGVVGKRWACPHLQRNVSTLKKYLKIFKVYLSISTLCNISPPHYLINNYSYMHFASVWHVFSQIQRDTL